MNPLESLMRPFAGMLNRNIAESIEASEICRKLDGKTVEISLRDTPLSVYFEFDDEYAGAVVEKLTQRKGELQEMRPGEGMGDIVTYRVAEIRNRLRRFEGRYGQVMRRILLVPVADADLIADLGVDDLEVN